ncbi:hypothetical protein RIF29_31946 [Crotalaria pallida]|uniref:Uncharacterized protein n=1 Tax=Crotalaria pallida TaxID=3830 RepID=A0AAN9EHP5_CROPI
MDSISDLPLLEIAAEDDSLLLTTRDAAIAATDDSRSILSSPATNVFSCSPLLSLRSQTPRSQSILGAVDSENLKPSLTDDDDGDMNKENTNWSGGAPKLSVEPQNVKKRKKKGGGYNLRKSVLNPVELSMISGTSTPSRTNTELRLNIINEEEEEEPTSASIAIRQIEENLFKQSSDNVSREIRNIACVGLSPKPAAPPSAAKRKVIATNDVAGNRSKRNACPRPVASSSYPFFHCIPDTTKAPSKESKLSKIPAPKSNASVFTTAARSGMLSIGSSKRNQNANPVMNVQKYAGAKIPSKNPRTMPSNPKADRADKPSVTRTLSKQAGKHLVNSISETRPPSRQHQPGIGANKISEVCLPQGVSHAGEKKQQTQFQSAKPSGLRMPSPSLGFFSQTKASSSDSQLKKSTKPSKPAECNISKLRKLETNSVDDARLPHAPMKKSEIVEGMAKHCTEKLSLSDVKSETSMQEDKMRMAGIEVRCDSLGCEKISDQEMVDNKQIGSEKEERDSLGFEERSKKETVENILEHININSKEHAEAELHKIDNISNMEDVQFPTHEKTLLSKCHTHEQLEKEDNHSLEDKSDDVSSNGDQSVFQEPQSMHHHSMARTSMGRDNNFNTMGNATKQDDDEQIKQLTCDVITSNESLVLQAKNGNSSDCSNHSGEFMEYNHMKTALVNSGFIDSSETMLGEHLQGIPFKSTEWVNDGAGDFSKCGLDEQVHLLNVNLLVHCNDNTESILEAANQQLRGEELETPNPCIVGEVSSKDENESHVYSCPLVHVTSLSCKGSPEKSIPEINHACENEPKIAEIGDCQHPGDGESNSIQRRPVNEGYDQVIDSKVAQDKSQAYESDRKCEDCIIVSAIAGSTEVNNVSPESRPFYENFEENPHFTSELCPMLNAGCDSRGNEMSVNESEFSEVSSDFIANTKDSPEKSTQEDNDACENESKIARIENCQHPLDGESGSIQRRPVDDTLYSKASPVKSIPEIKYACENEPKIANIEDCQHSADGELGCIQRRPVDEGHDQVIDSKAVHDIGQAFELDIMCEDCMTVSTAACSTEIKNVSPESRPFYENNIENLHFISELCPMVNAECDSTGNDMSVHNSCAISELQLREDGYSRDMSMQCDVQHDDPESCEQQASMLAYNEIIEMLCEDESLVPNHGHSLVESELSEISAAFIGSGAEYPSGLLQHTQLVQPIGGFDHTKREIEESHFEYTQTQTFNEDPVIYYCNDEKSLSVSNDQFPLAGDDNINEEPRLSELHLEGDGEWLSANTACSEEIKEKKLFAGALEGCDTCTSEHNASDQYIPVMPENKDANLDVECLEMGDAKKDSGDILPLVEVLLPQKVISAEFNYSAGVSEDLIAEIDHWKSDEHCSLKFFEKEESEEAETNIFEKEESPSTDMQHQTEGGSKIIDTEKSDTKSMQEVPTLKPPPNAAPFSDEWLAAIEAAGEEILTMKGGAVQNSPPEKPQHEPSPWSPVGSSFII